MCILNTGISIDKYRYLYFLLLHISLIEMQISVTEKEISLIEMQICIFEIQIAFFPVIIDTSISIRDLHFN